MIEPLKLLIDSGLAASLFPNSTTIAPKVSKTATIIADGGGSLINL